MYTVTVLTATYNRRHLLGELYASLCRQDDKEFEWVIIDDGSSDGTDELVNAWIDNSPFSVRYYQKTNGGKHTALNYGMREVHSKLVIIVDSDDVLTENAISTIKSVDKAYCGEEDLCGYSFLRGKTDGGLLSDSGVPQDGMKESFVDCRINRNIGGDMAEAWFVERLREFPFPEYPGERFLGEDVVWIQMSGQYKLRFFNQVISKTEYLADGLTHNRRRLNISSPNGCVKRAEVFLNAPVNTKMRIKSMLQYQIYGRFAGRTYTDLYQKCKHRMLFMLCFLPAGMLKYRWSKKWGQDK